MFADAIHCHQIGTVTEATATLFIYIQSFLFAGSRLFALTVLALLHFTSIVIP